MIKALFIIDAILYLILAIVGRQVYLKRKCQKVQPIEKPIEKPQEDIKARLNWIDYQLCDLYVARDENIHSATYPIEKLNARIEELENRKRKLEYKYANQMRHM